MSVSHEAIYTWIYARPKGELERAGIVLRTGREQQITLFEGGAPVLQVLTSDTDAPAAALLAWLRCRWRIENLFKSWRPTTASTGCATTRPASKTTTT